MPWLTKKIMVYSTLTLLGLTLALLFLFVRSSERDEEERHRSVEYLRKADNLEHLIRERVLENHSFLIDSYDSLAKVVGESNDLCDEILSPAGLLLRKHRNGEPDGVGIYCSLNRKKIEAIEEFKSENAVLVNTIRYFPSIIAAFKNPENRLHAFSIYSNILEYCLQPTEARSAVIEKQLTALYLNWRGPTDKRQLQSLLEHGTLALRVAMNRKRVENKIYSPEVQHAIAKLVHDYTRDNDKRENRTKYFKAGISTFCALLVIVLLVLLYRLERSAELLTDLNLDLEKKVAIRTEDLSKALSDLEMQQQIIAHSTKMSALGEMAGGIAHEINTPLAAISLKAESMMFMTSLSVETQKGLEEIISIVERLAKIVTGLRRFSRDSDKDQRKPYAMSAIIDETLILCAQKFKNNGVDLSVQCDPSLTVDCVPEQISQVLLNLLNNAYDAVSSLDQKWVAIEAGAQGGSACLRVVDSGTGIPESLQAKIMQPFFTTKEVGQGTGIGLSISRGIAQRHGGTFEYDASASHTTFQLKLPCVARAA